MKGSRTRWLVLAATVAVVAGILLMRPVYEHFFCHNINIGLSARAELNPWRRKLMPPQRVVEAMHLQRGMTVLDLGSGCGFFTFPLARAVGDEGRVFATDCSPGVADFLAREASRAGVRNVIPVVVQSSGLDAFYKANTFDVVFACDIVPFLGNPPEQRAFLSELGRSLRENGRLWVLIGRLDADFDVAEFDDWSVTLDALRFPGAQALVLKRLRPQVRAALVAEPATPAAESFRNLLVEDLNRLIEDPTLWPEIARQFQPLESYFSPRYQRPREYLVRKVEQAGGFTRTSQEVPERARPLLRVLNRLVIQDLLETSVWEKAYHVDEYQMTDWEHVMDGTAHMAETPALLQEAGYQLVREHKILTTHRIWEFRRAAPTK